MYNFFFHLVLSAMVILAIITFIFAYLKSKAAKEKDAENFSIYSSAEHFFLVLFLLCSILVWLIIEQELIITRFEKVSRYLEALKNG